MRVPLLSVAALMLALPIGAMAQSTGGPSTATPSTSAPPSATPMDQNSAGTVGGRFHRVDAMSQEQIRKSLEQAGFTNVRILDSAYLVQAQGANGETVTMMIDSAGPAAAGSSGGGVAGGAGSGTTGMGPGGSMGTATGTTTGGATNK